MEYNILGRTNLPVSKIGLGTWAYGNNVYGGVSELDGINAIHHAFHNGINLFDTAPQYGTKIQDGVAEIVLGKALKGIRKEVIIQTKFGRNPTIKDGSSQFNKERILASVFLNSKGLSKYAVAFATIFNPSVVRLFHEISLIPICKYLF